MDIFLVYGRYIINFKYLIVKVNMKIVIGTHNRDKLKEACPNVLVILAWNFADSIINQLGWYEEMGGRFLVPLPKPLFK